MAIISSATTIADNGAFSVNLGSLIFISEQTTTGAGTVAFTGLSSAYPIYKFEFLNCRPHTSYGDLMFDASTNGSTWNNQAKTTSFFSAINPSGIEYGAGSDAAQVSGRINLTDNTGGGSTQGASGTMFVYSPSSTTFVKHIQAHLNSYEASTSINTFTSGYINSTSAITAFRFSFRDHNLVGTIKLYGIKDS